MERRVVEWSLDTLDEALATLVSAHLSPIPLTIKTNARHLLVVR
jgi:hypothetical protein